MQFHFFLNPYFINIWIMMYLEIRGYSIVLGSNSFTYYIPPKMSQNFFIPHKGGGSPQIVDHHNWHIFSFKVSSSFLLIEVKRCWSFKGPKLFDPIPGLLSHPVINEWFHKGYRIIRYIQPTALLIVCGDLFYK